MERKRAEKKVATVAQTDAKSDLKPVRVDLAPGDHRLLRMVAAKHGQSMAAYARDTLAAVVRAEAEKEGLRP